MDRENETLLLLSQVTTNDSSPSNPSRLQGHDVGIRLLWHGVFPTCLSSNISLDKTQATVLVSRIIKLSLPTMYRLFLKRCEMLNSTFSGHVQLEEIITLRNDVRDVLNYEDCTHFFKLEQILRIKVDDTHTSTIRGQLFQNCSTCQEHASCEVINDRARLCLRQEVTHANNITYFSSMK